MHCADFRTAGLPLRGTEGEHQRAAAKSNIVHQISSIVYPSRYLHPMAKRPRKNPAPPPTITAPASAPKPAWYKSVRNQAGVLAVIACLLYVNTLGHDFAVDDAIVIYENTLVKQGLAGVGEIFSHDTFYGFFNDEAKANLVAGGRYRPLTLVLFAIEQQISRGPFIGHLFNVLWYGGLAALLAYFVHDLFPGPRLSVVGGAAGGAAIRSPPDPYRSGGQHQGAG